MSNTVIRTNVMSLNSHRNLGIVGTIQARASQRLSSGFRINSAADDAAGLGISEKMRAQIRGLDQASRNAQDGISLIQTAEGGMSTIGDMVHRIRELVVQAANDTNVHDGVAEGDVLWAQSDRVRIQDEINQLMDEIDATASRVEFNTRTLLDGTLAADREVMVGATPGGLQGVDAWTAGLANLNSQQQAFIARLATENIGYDLTLDMVNDALGHFDLASVGNISALFAEGGLSVAHMTGAQFAQAMGITFTEVNNAISNQVSEFFSAMATRMHHVFISGDIPANASVNWGAFADSLSTISTGANWSAGSNTVELFSSVFGASPANAAGFSNAISGAIYAASDAFVAMLVQQDPDGFFGPGMDFPGGFHDAATFTTFFNNRFGDAAVSAGALTDAAVALMGGQVTSAAPFAGTPTTIQGGRKLWFHIGANHNQGINTNIEAVGTRRMSEIGSAGAISALLLANSAQEMTASHAAQFTFSRLRTHETTNIVHPLATPPTHYGINAGVLNTEGQEIQNFIHSIDLAMAHVNRERSKLGAVQNRLEFAIENLDVASENLSAANSRIRDADMAQEMMRLTQANVLQQAAISMLAQANQAPQSVLQLLG